MRRLTEMTLTGPSPRHAGRDPGRGPGLSRDELMTHAMTGGFDMDLMLERLFDTAPERRT